MSRRDIALAIALAALVGVAPGCIDQIVPIGENDVGTLVPTASRERIDLLVVSDHSGAMQAKLSNVAARIQSVVGEILDGALDGPADLHIGVITSDMGTLDVHLGDLNCEMSDGGRLQRPDECTQVADLYLADDGRGTTNYSGTIEAAVACLMYSQVPSCGFEQPFAALVASLTAPENAEFFRDDARLVVMFLTDEDDCSVVDPAFFGPDSPELGPIDSYRCFSHTIACNEDVVPSATPGSTDGAGVKTGCHAVEDAPMMLPLEDVAAALIAAKGGDATMVTIAAFHGPVEPIEVGFYMPPDSEEPRLDLEPSCMYTGDNDIPTSADPALRLAWLADRFAGLSWSDSICHDVSETLPPAAEVTADAAAQRACLRGAFRDTDPRAAGLQPRCETFLVTDSLTAAEHREPVRACDDDGDDSACAAIVENRATCGHWLGLEVELRGITAGPGQAVLTNCEIEEVAP